MIDLTPLSIEPDSINSTRRWSLNQDLPSEVDSLLVDSIDRFGIIHPPIVRKSADSYEVICGSRRIAAAKQLSGLTYIPALIIGNTLDDYEILKIIAEDQYLSGQLSPIQTARLIAMASACDPQPGSESLSSLTRIPSKTKRGQLTRLLELEKPIRSAIHSGRCSVQTGIFLLDSTKTDRAIIFDLFSRLSLNANKQRRVIDLGRIVAAGRQCSFCDIFIRDYPELIDKPIDNIPQKTSLLLKNLYQQSHPLSSRAEENFNERVRGLKLPTHCRLSHSQSFEEETVTLEVDFQNFEDFKDRWEAIKRLLT